MFQSRLSDIVEPRDRAKTDLRLFRQFKISCQKIGIDFGFLRVAGSNSAQVTLSTLQNVTEFMRDDGHDGHAAIVVFIEFLAKQIPSERNGAARSWNIRVLLRGPGIHIQAFGFVGILEFCRIIEPKSRLHRKQVSDNPERPIKIPVD